MKLKKLGYLMLFPSVLGLLMLTLIIIHDFQTGDPPTLLTIVMYSLAMVVFTLMTIVVAWSFINDEEVDEEILE